MDSVVIQVDTVEPTGPWRRIMHDNDAGAGVVASTAAATAAAAAAAAAAARLSQSILSQGLGGKGQQRASAFTLKTKDSGSEVERPVPARSGVDNSYLRSPPSATSKAHPPSTPSSFGSTTSHASHSVNLSPPTSTVPALTPAGPKATLGFSRGIQHAGKYLASPSEEKHTQRLPPHAALFTKATVAGIDSIPQPRISLKRARPSTDVDGPLTSELGCKKRRLLRHLVTSPLSRRFSLPATYVPNLESTLGLTAGGGMEKRFLKLAAIAAARRMAPSSGPGAGAQQQLLRHHQHSPAPSELLRRAAIVNRLRMRALIEAAERGDTGVTEMAASTAMLRFSPGVQVAIPSSGLARFPGAPPASGSRPAAAAMPPPPRPSGAPQLPSPPPPTRPALFVNGDKGSVPMAPYTTTATSGGLGPSQVLGPSRPSAASHYPPPTPFALPATIMAARPLSRGAAVMARRSASPGMTPPGSPSRALRPTDAGSGTLMPMAARAGARLSSVSPRLRPLSCSADDDDDDGVAFPTSEHESRYESGDDLDDIYTDFSVMFGGRGGDGDDEDSMSDVDGYEEFMDDLDGIPWSAR